MSSNPHCTEIYCYDEERVSEKDEKDSIYSLQKSLDWQKTEPDEITRKEIFDKIKNILCMPLPRESHKKDFIAPQP